jgi:plasmid stability protein
MLSYDIYHAGVEAVDQIGDSAVAVIFNILRELGGANWKPVEIRFAHRRPDDLRPFQSFFRAPLTFDAEQNGVVFAADWLRRPVAGVDAGLRGQLQKQIEVLEAKYGDDLREQVRAVLRTALLSGHARADEIATAGRSRRTTLIPARVGAAVQIHRHRRARLDVAANRLHHRRQGVDQVGEGHGHRGHGLGRGA